MHETPTGSTLDPSILVEAVQTFANNPTEEQLDAIKAYLDAYQDDSFLLSPHLPALTERPLEAFKHALSSHDQITSKLPLYATYIYWLSKVVTHKILVRYFTHSPHDLAFLLKSASSPTFKQHTWETRYVILLWLTLVVNIPFPLEKLAQDAHNILQESVIKPWLAAPGKERDAAALLAGKYYTRADVPESRLASFLQWCQECIAKDSVDPFLATGIMQTLNCLFQDISQNALTPTLQASLYSFVALYAPEAAHGLTGQASSPLLRRYRAKYIGRLAVSYLLRPSSLQPSAPSEEAMPEQVEELVSELIQSLSDSDSRARWTSSKALARIARYLPAHALQDLTSSLVSAYSENLVQAPTPEQELTLVSAATWHGVTLCLAAMLRQHLLDHNAITTSVPWLLRALVFSQRKGAQKLGSNVRDAACYYFWCLARYNASSSPDAISGCIHAVAQTLVLVACTDEEVSVRRAASAAFQECAGRIESTPHRIGMLPIIDGYAVASRRSALLVAIPEIARLYPFYSAPIKDHLEQQLLFDHEVSLRLLSAQALASVIHRQEDKDDKLRQVVASIANSPPDARRAHGLLALSLHLLRQSRDAGLKATLFQSLAHIYASQSAGSSLVTLLPTISEIASLCFSEEPPARLDDSALDHQLIWRRFFVNAQKRPEPAVHTAAGQLIGAISSRFDCLADLKKALKTSSTPTSQIFLTSVLGCFDFGKASSCHELRDITIDRLLKLLDPKNTPTYKTAEAKCNALKSLAAILSRNSDLLEDNVKAITEALFKGLQDYTVTERGEVGHLVRISCLTAITDLVLARHRIGRINAALVDRLAIELLKQSCERMDTVRICAAAQIKRLRPVKDVVDMETLDHWRKPGAALPHALARLSHLESSQRQHLLRGIVISIGDDSEPQYTRISCFVAWLRKLEAPLANDPYTLNTLLGDLRTVIRTSHTESVSAAVMHTMAIVLEQQDIVAAASPALAEEVPLTALEKLAMRTGTSARSLRCRDAAQRLTNALRDLMSASPSGERAEQKARPD